MKNIIKIKNKSIKGLFDIIEKILVKIKIHKYKISKKKSPSINELENAIPNQLLKKIKK